MSSLFRSKKENITLPWNTPGEITHPALDTECQEKGRLEETSNNTGGLETMTDIRKLKKADCFNKHKSDDRHDDAGKSFKRR